MLVHNLKLVNAIDRAATDRLEQPGAFDAIVIGAGAAGDLAAERLTQAGLNVLVLDAARTGCLALRQGAIIQAVEVAKGRVAGGRWFDQTSRTVRIVSAPLA